jgi:hypothetical protein
MQLAVMRENIAVAVGHRHASSVGIYVVRVGAVERGEGSVL